MGSGSLILAVATAALLAGCRTECDDLQEVCDACADPVQRLGCDAAAGVGDETICEQQMPVYQGEACSGAVP